MNNRTARYLRSKKEFVNSYHINEVPLPYYNPLADPYLTGFFSSRHTERHISNLGLLYSPKKEYPYESRRTKNGYKFYRDNSFEIPPENINKSKVYSKSEFVGLRKMDFYE